MRRRSTDREGFARELANLPMLDRAALKHRWQELYNSEPPERTSQLLLQLGIAYRLQENFLGGLKPQTRRALDRAAADIASGRPLAPPRRIKAGTRLLREWQGTTHEVTVLTEGVLYNGERYRSLSDVACRITGAHRSGPAFFGLKARRTDAA